MIKKGKLVLEQKVTVEGDDYLKCTLKSFDSKIRVFRIDGC